MRATPCNSGNKGSSCEGYYCGKVIQIKTLFNGFPLGQRYLHKGQDRRGFEIFRVVNVVVAQTNRCNLSMVTRWMYEGVALGSRETRGSSKERLQKLQESPAQNCGEADVGDYDEVYKPYRRIISTHTYRSKDLPGVNGKEAERN